VVVINSAGQQATLANGFTYIKVHLYQVIF